MTREPPVAALKAMAHPLRFRILEALHLGELNVGEIEARTKIGQPALSQQLAILRGAGLVETRKEAKLVFYALSGPVISELAQAIGHLAGRQDERAPETAKASPGVANFARLT